MMEDLDIETNFVTYSNVEIDYKSNPGAVERFYEKMQAVEEQIISGLKLVPLLLGRSYGVSGTWAEAQARLMERASKQAQLGVKRFMERLYDLALRLWGHPQYRVEVKFQETNLNESLKLAQAEQVNFNTGQKMYEQGLITQDELAARMGVKKAAADKPLSRTKSIPPTIHRSFP